MVSFLTSIVAAAVTIAVSLAFNEMTLYIEELTGSLTTASLVNWSCILPKTVGVGTSDCQHFAQPSFGPYTGNTQLGRLITSIPPHNRVVFNLNVLMVYAATIYAATETLVTKIDGSVADTLTFQSFTGVNFAYEFTSWSNVTQSLDTVQISVVPSFDLTMPDHQYYIRDFRMWYIPCHKSCSVCLSTDKDTCITCPLFATMSGTQCICDNGYYLYKNTCVTLCPVGYTTDTVAKECLLNVLNCGTPASITTCSACNAGYFLNVLDLLCYLKCPQALETVGTNCQPYYYKLSTTTAYEAMGMYDRPWTGNSETSYEGVSVTQCSTAGICEQPKSKFQNWCGDEKIFGGYSRVGQTTLSKTLSGLGAHYRFRFYVDLYFIDDWTAGGSIVISFSNGSTYTKTIGDCAGASFMCGSPAVPDCKLSFDVTELHTGTSLTWSIATTVAYHTLDQSFGLNNLHVEIDLCTPNCQVCDATGCLTCNASTYLHLVDKLCYAVCPVGYYGDSVSKTCLTCALQCNTCLTTSTNCLTCAGNRTLPPTCNCPDGLFSLGGTDPNCSVCSFRCATCSMASATCLTCAAKRDTTTLPTCSCLVNTYEINGTPACQDCFNVCSHCTGPNQSDCIACKSATRDPANFCNCLTHYYGPITNQDCLICDITCQDCTAGTSNDCTSCPSGSAPANTLPRVFSSGKCVCPVGTYDDGSAYCPVCNYRCAQCTGPTYSSTDCQVCKPGRDITNNCQCLAGYDTGVALCAPCPVQCGTCTPLGVCLTCSSVNRVGIPTCACTTGFYDDGTAACAACNPICLTCTNATTCTSCQPGRDAPNCACSYGTYSNASNVCTPCHQNCASCFGGSSIQCLQCAPNRTIPPTCTCPDGYFQVAGQVRCPKCDSSCLTCDGGSANSCTSCDTSIRILYGTSCVCKVNMYENIYGDCVSCGSHCATCASDGTCTKCAGNRVGAACNCPAGTYDSGVDICPACSSQCSECLGSASNCTTCGTNRTGTPACNCSSNAYLPTATPTACLVCATKCSSCNGAADKCLSCSGNRYFVSSSNDCLCPSYTYEDSISVSCPTCHRSCKQCTGATNGDCISCRDTYSMNSVGKCVCLSGYYEDIVNVQCRACDSSCKTCSGAGSSACSDCSSGYQWVNSVCVANGTSSCSALCSACDSSYKCTGCTDASRELVNGQCMCLGGTYDNNSKCYSCDNSCKQCSGPSASNCTYCRTGYSLVTGTCQPDVTQQESSSVMTIILCVFGGLFFFVAMYVVYRAITKHMAAKQLQGYKNAQLEEDSAQAASRDKREEEEQQERNRYYPNNSTRYFPSPQRFY